MFSSAKYSFACVELLFINCIKQVPTLNALISRTKHTMGVKKKQT